MNKNYELRTFPGIKKSGHSAAKSREYLNQESLLNLQIKIIRPDPLSIVVQSLRQVQSAEALTRNPVKSS